MCKHPHTSTATLPNALYRKHRQQLKSSSSYSSRYPLPAPRFLQLLQGHTPLTGDAHQVLCAPANTCLLVPRAGCGLPSSCQSHSPPATVFKNVHSDLHHALSLFTNSVKSAPKQTAASGPHPSFLLSSGHFSTSTRPSPACPCVPVPSLGQWCMPCTASKDKERMGTAISSGQK